MEVWKFLFWISVLLIFYNYAGYAILIYIINSVKKLAGIVQKNQDTSLPTVSFIVAAYNEEACIEEKIKNSLEQNYPPDLIQFIFIMDGSTDKTTEITGKYPSVISLYKPERRGKSASLNRAVAIAKNDILIFSDANTILNKEATLNIAKHYSNPKVGGVAGEKKVLSAAKKSANLGESEGLYWKYESFLKKIDSDFYSVVGAAGELFSLRRELFEPLPDSVILDDFIISLKVAQKGYRIIYELDAYAMELPSFSLKDEQKRKIRIAAGGFQAMGMLGSLLYFWKHPKLSFLYISHRVLRWTLSPLCLVIAFIANLILFLSKESDIYTTLFIIQLCFYLMALAGSFSNFKPGQLKPFKLAYYFVFMNTSVFLGFLRFIRGKQPATWEKARRIQG